MKTTILFGTVGLNIRVPTYDREDVQIFQRPLQRKSNVILYL
ncbi:Uncharacterised protein [Chryseobacterium gleum]|uniref:Uncharacterized protein n=1 Tax=Chryseobacterium gleum TaxID=250 RepID=A0A3S4NYE0_CHRGE|nr:Uncharacterised protein [Chryseobacterium gleum]VFA44040.1 Uncharacterised protein [Chryseobacterium indologenes]